MFATEYAEYYNLPPQEENESNQVFQERIAETLREQGNLIEAHEVLNDERYEQSEDVMTGIIGALAQALSGTSYGGSQVGNDIAAGTIARHQMSPEGQREQEGRRFMAKMLTGGMSPDAMKDLLG